MEGKKNSEAAGARKMPSHRSEGITCPVVKVEKVEKVKKVEKLKNQNNLEVVNPENLECEQVPESLEVSSDLEIVNPENLECEQVPESLEVSSDLEIVNPENLECEQVPESLEVSSDLEIVNPGNLECEQVPESLEVSSDSEKLVKRGRPVKRGKKSVGQKVRAVGGNVSEQIAGMRRSEMRKKETNLLIVKKGQYKKTRETATNARIAKRKLNVDNCKLVDPVNSVKAKKHFLNKVFAHDPQVYGFPSKNMTVSMQKALKIAFERKCRHGSMNAHYVHGKRYLRCVKRRDYVKELKADKVTLELKEKEYRCFKKKLVRKQRELPNGWKLLNEKAGGKIVRVLKKKQKREIKLAAIYLETRKLKRKLDNVISTVKTLKYKHAYWNEMFKIRQELNNAKISTQTRERVRKYRKVNATKALLQSRKLLMKFCRKKSENLCTKLAVAKILDRVHGTKSAEKLRHIETDKCIQKEIMNYAGSGDRLQDGTECERKKKQVNLVTCSSRTLRNCETTRYTAATFVRGM